MKHTSSILIIFLLFCISLSCNRKQPALDKDTLKLVFITDTHIERARKAPQGFALAIDSINSLKPHLVIHGGDIIMDALKMGHAESMTQFQLYDSLLQLIEAPVYHAIGNHDIWGWYLKDSAVVQHPDYGKAMFEKRFGSRFQSFGVNNWQFILLDGLLLDSTGNYYGGIDYSQLAWIEDLLAGLDTSKNIALVSHIPLMTVFGQLWNGPTAANSPGVVITNADSLLKLFENHRLKLVLQGHLHIIEDIYVNDIHFITGGAISARWWRGPNKDLQEGFMLLNLTDSGEISWRYVDYGWEAAAEMN